ncbi:MAG: response regulator transcription factor [Eubacterium sp.]|nr:response regulator transcription factor [Eubacterium sp.]
MIWCVDDDNTIRDLEVYTLEQTGFQVKGFADGISMLKALESEMPELIILDIMLPEMDGIEILKKIREDQRYENIPIIMATAKGTEMDKIGGLNSGADDYLVKPFGVMEMVARVKAVLRRMTKDEDEGTLVVGNISMKEKEHMVFVQGEKVELTHKEFELLKFFMEHREVVFSRDELMNNIWGMAYVAETRTVDMHIKTLRQKLGSAGGQIKTVIGVGYRLESEV